MSLEVAPQQPRKREPVSPERKAELEKVLSDQIFSMRMAQIELSRVIMQYPKLRIDHQESRSGAHIIVVPMEGASENSPQNAKLDIYANTDKIFFIRTSIVGAGAVDTINFDGHSRDSLRDLVKNLVSEQLHILNAEL